MCCQVLVAQRPVADAEPFLRGQAQHPHLAMMQVPVDIQGGLAGILHRVDHRHGRVNHALGHQAVGLPRLTVVGEVRADDAVRLIHR